MILIAFARASSTVTGPNRPNVMKRLGAERPSFGRYRRMKVLVPLASTRRPNPGRTASQTMYRKREGTAASAVLFVNFDFRLSALKPTNPAGFVVTTW